MRKKTQMQIIAIIILVFTLFTFAQQSSSDAYKWPATLSEWQLFESPMAYLHPEIGIIPYEVNAPLYSDYAQKSRFIRLPSGRSSQFHPKQVFNMPDGTILIKNFFYFSDERQPSSGRQILETRLIVRDQGTWHAMTYRWNNEQSEATRAIAGGSIDVTWKDKTGKTQQLHYLIPDVNQCKNCHNKNDEFLPLGITARQLHGPAHDQQLMQWQEQGILTGVPANPDTIDQLTDYHNPHLSLESRARSYLDANCGHCHSPEGSARTSGLNLDFNETNPHAWGVMKPPIAAGRGSGDLRYSIVPGKPNQSILLYRMESDDPGVRMPEINRQIPHAEGIALIREWIKNMDDR